MNKELIEALKQIEDERQLEPGTMREALESALSVAYKKEYHIEDEEADVRVEIDGDSGEIRVYKREISTEDNPEAEPAAEVDVTPKNFGRVAAQVVKQVIYLKIKEAERANIYEEYQDRVDEIVTGIVEQSDHRYTLVNLGERAEALLPLSEQTPGERYEHGNRIKVYIVEVKKTTKEPAIVVSRTHPGLIRRLFELEVPEIYDGYVEIKSVAREAGHRSKIAVASRDKSIDPVGACVGPKGSRVRMVVNELRNEKIDIVEYSDDPKIFVTNALSPAKVKDVMIDESEHTAEVIVPDSQLSLAIGKEGQNARLAAKLTGWRVDIKSESNVGSDTLDYQAHGTENLVSDETVDIDELSSDALASQDDMAEPIDPRSSVE